MLLCASPFLKSSTLDASLGSLEKAVRCFFNRRQVLIGRHLQLILGMETVKKKKKNNVEDVRPALQLRCSFNAVCFILIAFHYLCAIPATSFSRSTASRLKQWQANDKKVMSDGKLSSIHP